MKEGLGLRKHFLITCLLVMLLGLVLSGCAGNETNTKKEKIDTKKVQEMSAYIGTDACITCHSKTGQGFAMTSHAEIFKSQDQYNTDWKQADTCAECHSPGLVAEGLGVKNLEPGISCETCHGPGSIHAQTKRKETISINQNACITCHTLGQPSETKDGSSLIAENHYGTRNWFASDHYTSGYVNCLNCHTSHEVNQEGLMLKGTFTENCASCHKNETFDIEEIMWKNPTDLHSHITRDHSFGAIPYEKIGDNPETKEVEITDPTTIKKLKSLMK